jgi:hypothetical protein
MAGMPERLGLESAPPFAQQTHFMKFRPAGIFTNIRKGKTLLWQKA